MVVGRKGALSWRCGYIIKYVLFFHGVRFSRGSSRMLTSSPSRLPLCSQRILLQCHQSCDSFFPSANEVPSRPPPPACQTWWTNVSESKGNVNSDTMVSLPVQGLFAPCWHGFTLLSVSRTLQVPPLSVGNLEPDGSPCESGLMERSLMKIPRHLKLRFWHSFWLPGNKWHFSCGWLNCNEEN